MGIENFNNYVQPQERIEFFKNEVSYGLLREEGLYDIYVVCEGLHSRYHETISGQLKQIVSLFYFYYPDNDTKIKMRDLLIGNINIISKGFDGFANLDIVKEYKSDILILKDKCLKYISDFMYGNEVDIEMIEPYERIMSEIDKLYEKMKDDENLKDYRVVHLNNVKNLEEIDGRIQEIKEEYKNGNNSEDHQDLASDKNSQEIAIQSTKEEARKEPLIQRIKNLLSSILNKTK